MEVENSTLLRVKIKGIAKSTYGLNGLKNPDPGEADTTTKGSSDLFS
jgi:hypothetical protein